MRAWIAAGLLCVSYVAASVDRSPSQNSAADQESASDERGGPARPLVVILKKQQPTSDEQAAAEDDRQEKRESLVYEKRLAFWTIALSIATILLMLFTGALFWVTRKIAKDTRDLGHQANENARYQTRAYVLPGESRIFGLLGGEPLRLVIELKNFGVTPAIDVRYAAQMVFAAPDEAAKRVVAVLDGAAAENATRATLPSQGVISVIFDDGISLSPAEVADLKNGKKAIAAHGTIYFSDVFGEDQSFPFRFIVGGEHGLTPHKDGGHYLTPARVV